MLCSREGMQLAAHDAIVSSVCASVFTFKEGVVVIKPAK